MEIPFASCRTNIWLKNTIAWPASLDWPPCAFLFLANLNIMDSIPGNYSSLFSSSSSSSFVVSSLLNSISSVFPPDSSQSPDNILSNSSRGITASCFFVLFTVSFILMCRAQCWGICRCCRSYHPASAGAAHYDSLSNNPYRKRSSSNPSPYAPDVLLIGNSTSANTVGASAWMKLNFHILLLIGCASMFQSCSFSNVFTK